MNRTVLSLLVFCIAAGYLVQPAVAATINFDVDANGNAIVAPIWFQNTTRLTNSYAALGVSFSGASGNDGGAILNKDGNFGILPLTGDNFLSFNIENNAVLQDGGLPVGPENIQFSTPVNHVSIFGGCGYFTVVTLRMQAFNALDQLVATDTQTSPSFGYTQLSVTGSGITRVTLERVSGNTSWLFDNLIFTVVPEPSTFVTSVLGAFGLLIAIRRQN